MNGYFFDPYPSFQHEPKSWVHFHQSQLVVPLNFRFNFSEQFFVVAGIDHTVFLNHKGVNDKSEDNGTIGLGRHMGNLSCTISYQEGFHKQGVLRVIESKQYASGYKNRMLQLSIYCPIWQIK